MDKVVRGHSRPVDIAAQSVKVWCGRGPNETELGYRAARCTRRWPSLPLLDWQGGGHRCLGWRGSSQSLRCRRARRSDSCSVLSWFPSFLYGIGSEVSYQARSLCVSADLKWRSQFGRRKQAKKRGRVRFVLKVERGCSSSGSMTVTTYLDRGICYGRRYY